MLSLPSESQGYIREMCSMRRTKRIEGRSLGMGHHQVDMTFFFNLWDVFGLLCRFHCTIPALFGRLYFSLLGRVQVKPYPHVPTHTNRIPWYIVIFVRLYFIKALSITTSSTWIFFSNSSLSSLWSLDSWKYRFYWWTFWCVDAAAGWD